MVIDEMNEHVFFIIGTVFLLPLEPQKNFEAGPSSFSKQFSTKEPSLDGLSLNKFSKAA